MKGFTTPRDLVAKFCCVPTVKLPPDWDADWSDSLAKDCSYLLFLSSRFRLSFAAFRSISRACLSRPFLAFWLDLHALLSLIAHIYSYLRLLCVFSMFLLLFLDYASNLLFLKVLLLVADVVEDGYNVDDVGSIP